MITAKFWIALTIMAFWFASTVNKSIKSFLERSSAIYLSVQKLASNHEIVIDRIETAFGDDDKVVRFDTLRVKKFNRTA